MDIIPIENGHTEKYRLLIAPGYNCANADDITKLTHYVKDGGTLVIGWPQLSIATERETVVSYRHSYITPEELPSEPLFISDTKDGAPIRVCNNIRKGEVVLKTDSGLPLAHLFKIGKGKVYFINAKEYAANTAVDAAYRDVLDIAVKDCLMQESVYAEGDDNIQFTVFNNDDGSKNIYFVATDWHKDLGDGVGKINLGITLTAYPCRLARS